MEPIRIIKSKAVPLDMVNVDTDQIIPKQFLKLIHKTGYGKFLFYDWRFNSDGKLSEDFVLTVQSITDDRYCLLAIILEVGVLANMRLGPFVTTVLRQLLLPHLLIFFTVTASKMEFYQLGLLIKSLTICFRMLTTLN